MAFNRISARRGRDVNLDLTFFNGGIPADPFAIYAVEIYRGKIDSCNLIETILIDDVDGSSYPNPLVRQPELAESELGQCGGVGFVGCDSDSGTGTDSNDDGKFRLVWDVPSNVVVPDVYFDVWHYWPTDPRSGTTGDLSDYIDSLLSNTSRFWVYPDDWYSDGGLQTIRFSFEPLDQKFRKPEKRPLEVGLMPLPLYDYDYNLVQPLIPYLSPKITIWSSNDELILDNASMIIKLRQGSFRSNPWVASYMMDTCRLLKGTYKYRITLNIPDGSTRVSDDLIFTIS